MSAVPMHRFSLRVTAADGDVADPDVVEQFALDLRTELSEGDLAQIDQVVAAPAPEGARVVEILAAFEFIITMVEAGEAVGKILDAIRRVAVRYAQRRKRLRVTVADVEIDLATANDAQRLVVVNALMAQAVMPGTGVRRALIIANKEFDDPALTQLRAPGHDADALARVLGNAAIGGFQVDLLTDADERTIRNSIAEFFADRRHDDVLLLHFSGHGVKDTRGRLFLTARDTRLARLGATGIAASFINDQLAETLSKRVVLILDCCYSGAFARGAGVRGDDSVHIDDAFGAGNGRIVLTASSATEYAFEGTDLTRSEGQPSAFTSALVHGLESGEADLDADGEISIDELYDYTYRSVRATTPGQAPMKWSFGVEGSLVIARSIRPAVLPPQIIDDLESDRGVLREEAVKALARLLASGKRGQQVAAAAALVRLKDNDDSARVRAAAAAVLGVAPVVAVVPPTQVVRSATTSAPVATGPVASTPVAPATVARTPIAPASTAPTPAGRASVAPSSVAPTSVPPAAAAPTAAAPTTAAPTTAAPTGVAAASSGPPSRLPVSTGPTSGRPAPEASGEPVGTGTPLPAARSGHRGLIVCGVVTLLSIIFDAIGAAASNSWPPPLIVFDSMEFVAAVALIGSRRVIWGGLVVGLLSWEWALVGIYQNDTVAYALGSGHVPDVLGNLIGIVALIAGIIGLFRTTGYVEVRRVWARLASAALLLALTVVLSIECAYMLTIAFQASLDTADGWIYGIGFVTGLVLPLFAIGRPEWVATRFIAVGWLVGGFIIAIGVEGTTGEGLNVQFTLIMLVITGIAMLVILWPWRTRSRLMSASRSLRDDGQPTL